MHNSPGGQDPPGLQKHAPVPSRLCRGNRGSDACLLGAPSFPQISCFRSSSWLERAVLLGSLPEPSCFPRAFLLLLNGVVQNRVFHRAPGDPCLGAPTLKRSPLPCSGRGVRLYPNLASLVGAGPRPEGRYQRNFSGQQSHLLLQLSLSLVLLSRNLGAGWNSPSRKSLVRESSLGRHRSQSDRKAAERGSRRSSPISWFIGHFASPLSVQCVIPLQQARASAISTDPPSL